jgi:hypothetical protein
MTKSVEELQAYLRQFPTIMRGQGRFEAKLSFDERCSVLALYMSGIHRRVLASAFGIDRRTVAHIYNKNSIHYKNVRSKLEELGRDAFIQRYLTEEASERVTAVANNPEVTLSDDQLRKEPVKPPVPNKRRNRRAGINMLTPPQCDYSHRVMIAWRDQTYDPVSGVDLPEGWWYQDMDGNNPDEWFYSGPQSLLSSSNALKAAELEIIDRL